MDIRHYFDRFAQALDSISSSELDRATAILDEAYRYDHTIYVVGNGQSAATSSAFALDLTKQTVLRSSVRRFRVISLTDNISALTAWANDVNYEAIFTEQLKSLFRTDDVLLAISVSGNSPNVVNACQWVQQQGGKVIGMVGFDGGCIKQFADACIVVDSCDYGHVETAHIALMHYWVDLFRERLHQ